MFPNALNGQKQKQQKTPEEWMVAKAIAANNVLYQVRVNSVGAMLNPRA